MIVEFRLRRSTSEEWIADNPVLADGEPGFDTTARALKMGDGVTPWVDLDYISGSGGGGGGTGVVTWDTVTDKPSTFAPSAHQHNNTDIVGLTEAIQDAVAAMIAGGSGITATYNDTTGTLTLAATGGGGGGATDPEVVRDTIGAALSGSGLVSVSINDAGDTITVSTSATQNSSDAQLRDRSTHTGTQAISTIDQLQSSLNGKQDAGWAGMPPQSAVWIKFNTATNTWPVPPTSRLDIHFEYQGGDASHPPPGRAGTVGHDDVWTWDAP